MGRTLSIEKELYDDLFFNKGKLFIKQHQSERDTNKHKKIKIGTQFDRHLSK